MNLSPWFLMSHAGDYYANTEVAAMRRQFKDMEFFSLRSPAAVIAANLRVVLLQAAASVPGMDWRWRALKPLYYLRYSTYLPKAYLRRVQPDVIFAHGQIPRISADCPIPLVGIEYFASDSHLRIVDALHLKPLDIEAKRWSTSRASALITTTPGSKLRLEEYIPETRGRLTQVPIYMPYLEPISTECTVAKQEQDGPVRVLFVGATARRKGLPQLLEALRMLDSKTRRALELTVVSRFADGPVNNVTCEARVLSGLSMDNLIQLMNESHIFAFPTQFDTFGRVIVEAMASGCAILTSNADPQDWLLDFGNAGIGVNPTCPEEIAAGLTLLVNDTRIRTSLAIKALTRFRETFYHSVVAERYRLIFDKVTGA